MVICCNSTYVFIANILPNKIFLIIYKQIISNGIFNSNITYHVSNIFNK